MTEEQREQILAELAAYTAQPKLEKYEFTVEDVAQRENLSHGSAARKLRQLVVAGVLRMRTGVYDARVGKLVNAYSRSENGKAVGG